MDTMRLQRLEVRRATVQGNRHVLYHAWSTAPAVTLNILSIPRGRNNSFGFLCRVSILSLSGKVQNLNIDPPLLNYSFFYIQKLRENIITHLFYQPHL